MYRYINYGYPYRGIQGRIGFGVTIFLNLGCTILGVPLKRAVVHILMYIGSPCSGNNHMYVAIATRAVSVVLVLVLLVVIVLGG